MSGVFAQLNRGDEVTKGLRKVDASEMTHKNPSLRTGAAPPPAVKPKPASMGGPSTSAAAAPAKKQPKKELDGKAWNIENFDGDRQIVVDGVELNHTVNVFNCKNSIIQVKGKLNAISLGTSLAARRPHHRC